MHTRIFHLSNYDNCRDFEFEFEIEFIHNEVRIHFKIPTFINIYTNLLQKFIH